MSDSLPPDLLRGYEQSDLSREGGRPTVSGDTPLTVAAGEPGTYTPELTPGERPRNVTELRERARSADPAPWVEGAYVLIGTSGKRAHWGGDDWHGGESPGYPEPIEPDDRSEGGEAPDLTELVDADEGDDA